jgi:hypothetical protein
MAVFFYLTSLLLVCGSVTAIDVMRYASVQYSILYQEFLDSSKHFYPWYGYPLEDEWKTTTSVNGWTPGFFAGVFWNLLEYNITREALTRAVDVTAPITSITNHTGGGGIDLGFIIMSSFGNGYRLLKRPEYLDIIVVSAHILSALYSPVIQCTHPINRTGNFLIYIDNIMNLELLFEAANHTKNQTLYNIAWQYANITLYEQFRENNSTYHIVEYNQTVCSVIRKYTAQGK